MSKFSNRLNFTKLLRVKQIEDNKGKTIVSEGIDANSRHDKYSFFCINSNGLRSSK
jgi:hypothetical protein